MSTNGVSAGGTNSIGWGNEGRVQRGNDAIVSKAYADAKARGEVTFTVLKDFQVTELKAQLGKGTKSPGDRIVDLGNGEKLINVSDRVYLQAGETYSSVSGFKFPPMRMASPRRL